MSEIYDRGGEAVRRHQFCGVYSQLSKFRAGNIRVKGGNAALGENNNRAVLHLERLPEQPFGIDAAQFLSIPLVFRSQLRNHQNLEWLIRGLLGNIANSGDVNFLGGRRVNPDGIIS